MPKVGGVPTYTCRPNPNPQTKIDNKKWVRLMYAFRTHIKLFNFRNILSEIKKIVIIFSILEKKKFSKIKINICA